MGKRILMRDMDKYEEEFINLLRHICLDGNGGYIPAMIAGGVMMVCPQEAERVKREIEYMQKLNINTYG